MNLMCLIGKHGDWVAGKCARCQKSWSKEDAERAVVKMVQAATDGDADTVRASIKSGANVNAMTNRLTDGGPALLEASFYGHNSVVDLLLKNGANVNIKDERGMTALLTASMKGQVEVVKLLLKNGADVNAKGAKGITSLMAASIGGQNEIKNLLRAAGAKE